jgi:hypothetical protein
MSLLTYSKEGPIDIYQLSSYGVTRITATYVVLHVTKCYSSLTTPYVRNGPYSYKIGCHLLICAKVLELRGTLLFLFICFRVGARQGRLPLPYTLGVVRKIGVTSDVKSPILINIRKEILVTDDVTRVKCYQTKWWERVERLEDQ